MELDSVSCNPECTMVQYNVPSKLCSCSCAHRTSAHKKTWRAHKCSIQKCFLHIFHTHHSKFRWVQVKFCTKEILCTRRL